MSLHDELRRAVFAMLQAACPGLDGQNIVHASDVGVRPTTAYLTFRLSRYKSPRNGFLSRSRVHTDSGAQAAVRGSYTVLVDVVGYFRGARDLIEALDLATIQAPPGSTQMGSMAVQSVGEIVDVSTLRDNAIEHRISRTLSIGYEWTEAPQPVPAAQRVCATIRADLQGSAQDVEHDINSDT